MLGSARSWGLAYPTGRLSKSQTARIFTIGSSPVDLRNYPYANHGDHSDVAAPGVDIWTAVPGAREGYHSGTSFAAPFVTAVLAALPQNALQGSKDQFLDRLKIVDLGPPGRDPIYGRGLIQAPSTCNTPDNTTVATSTAQPALSLP